MSILQDEPAASNRAENGLASSPLNGRTPNESSTSDGLPESAFPLSRPLCLFRPLLLCLAASEKRPRTVFFLEMFGDSLPPCCKRERELSGFIFLLSKSLTLYFKDQARPLFFSDSLAAFSLSFHLAGVMKGRRRGQVKMKEDEAAAALILVALKAVKAAILLL